MYIKKQMATGDQHSWEATNLTIVMYIGMITGIALCATIYNHYEMQNSSLHTT